MKLFGAEGAEATRRSAWSWVLSALLAAALLWWALRGVEWKRVAGIIGHAEWKLVLAAAATTCFSLFLRSLRWRILLNATGSLSVGTVFWANNAGYLGNNFLPARAGELIRSFLISSRSKLSRTYVLTTALSERLMDVIALVLWSSLLLLGVYPKPRWMSDLSRTLALVATVGAAAMVVLPHSGRLLEIVLRKIPVPERLRKVLMSLAGQILSGVAAFHDWRRLTGFTVLTIVIWLSDAVGVMAMGRALNLPLPFATAFLLLAGLGLGSALPSTPGYVGIYQFVAVTVLSPFGIGRDSSVALILAVQATNYAVVLVLGLIGLYQLQGNPRKMKSS